MAMTDVQISNMALGHIGVQQQIASLSTEHSTESNKCSLYYTQAVESVLADYPWPFATKYATLGLVTDNSALSTPYDWLYEYRYPSDCLFVRRIVTVLGRKDPNPPPFRIGQDDQGLLVYTDQEDAVIEYTRRVTDTNLFPPTFAEAVSWRLAAFIAPGLSRLKDMVRLAMLTYLGILSKAETQAGNEQQQQDQIESEFIRARD